MEDYLELLRRKNKELADFLHYDIIESEEFRGKDKYLGLHFGHNEGWVRNTRKRAKIALIEIIRSQKEEAIRKRYRIVFKSFEVYWPNSKRKEILECYLNKSKTIEEIAKFYGKTPNIIGKTISKALIELNKIANSFRPQVGYEDEEGNWHIKTKVEKDEDNDE